MSWPVKLSDIEAALGREIASDVERSRAQHLLDSAVTVFSREAGIRFGAGQACCFFLVRDGYVRIPQPGVTKIVSVLDLAGNPVSYGFHRDYLQVFQVEADLDWVQVRFDYDFTPPEVVSVRITELAVRSFSIDKYARAGLTQFSKTDGPFTRSRSYASWASGGQTLLSPEDRRLARSLRVSRPVSPILLEARRV